MRINGDLDHTRGLLKLWITNEERTTASRKPATRAVLSRIPSVQDTMHEVIQSVVHIESVNDYHNMGVVFAPTAAWHCRYS